ncbi:hypothetical protein [Pseudobacteriovorax antillogorgiicola]|uniref:Uncharacterized protein n=1 Tax=Pseudobacteriovorax antillogorgiicola TaxID=1513793 RepID=A0A1Y6C9M0_9BACT|nr:hypothetical protein [Pseudobacteriovorax antillogorgiicola]TCS50774.1 hypothetical protein EDD56_112157 [Pseudobacteriovorax antillogorgiicola]SMF41360.1 hypothetical protein SAMN06296036_112156 [Pseudobacteriovorax antillogorgiicola]
MKKTPDEILGFEYDWLACDEIGNIALFSTAGGGFAPAAFLEDTDKYDEMIDRLKSQSVTSSAAFAPKLSDGLPNIWKELAERGIYSFDSDEDGGPYRLIGVPDKPIKLDKLAGDIAESIKPIRFGKLRFDKVNSITIADFRKNGIK